MSLNINGNVNFNKVFKIGIPLGFTDRIIYEGVQGADLVNLLGVDIPFVSGVGLDSIYDFGVLNDLRFDKGSYLSNVFGNPEYYKFPYPPEIYYNDTTSATRNYWKLTDFYYRILLEQANTLKNVFFLKATTDENYLINDVSELIIYPNELMYKDLILAKRYINILADYRGVNLFAYTKIIDSNEDGLADGYIVNLTGVTPSIVIGNGFTGNAQRCDIISDGFFNLSSSINLSGIYEIEINYRSLLGMRFTDILGNNIGACDPNTDDAIMCTLKSFLDTSGFRIYPRITESQTGDWFEVNGIKIYFMYINYYKQTP